MAIFTRSLHLYPLKSGSSVDVKTALVHPDGLQDDRRMMVVSEDGRFLTSRQHPDLLKIHCILDRDTVTLATVGRQEVTFPREPPAVANYRNASIWQDQVDLLDAGDAAAHWLSCFLGRPSRLMLQGPLTRRSLLDRQGSVHLADTAPILLISEASLAMLNEHLEMPAEMARFRPNIVVRGGTAFQEDEWAVLRIGNVEFEAIGPCSRCKVVTLDPNSGDERRGSEPLATLSRIRRGFDGEAYFGEFLQPRSGGRIHAGDPITVSSRKPRPKLHPVSPSSRVPAFWPSSQVDAGALELRCTGMTEETKDIRTFRFQVQGGAWANYQPGQFLTLHLPLEGELLKRNYTISSSPTRPHQLAISVKRVSGGRVSNWLHENLRPGMTVKAFAPSGRFHLGALGHLPTNKLLMLSAGSGVTPMISMLRAIADLDLPFDIKFHHSCRTTGDMAFRAELAGLKVQLGDRLHVTWNLTGRSESESRRDDVFHGRLSDTMLSFVCEDIADRLTLCCGPEDFRNAVRSIHAHRAPGAGLVEESFGAAPDRHLEELPEPYAIYFARSGKTATGSGVPTILELARACNVPLEADCEAGICGRCRCRVAEGEWRLSARCADPDRLALSDKDKSENYVLACTTRMLGRGTVDL